MYVSKSAKLCYLFLSKMFMALYMEHHMITYDYYRIFYYVASCRSLTKAARILGNNQPNITRSMNNLESELGCKLMQRSNRGITLTPNGKALFEHVAIAFDQLESGEREIRQDLNMESGHVTIAASETSLRVLLLPVLRNFQLKFPEIHISISNHATPQAIRTLQSGLADFAIATTPLDIRQPLIAEPLCDFREIPIAGLKYVDLESETLTLKDLKKYPLISVGRNTGTREFYVKYFMDHHLSFHPELEASSTDQILPMVEYNLGIGFYPEDLARDAINRKRICPLHLTEDIPERTFCLVMDQTHVMSTAARRLITDIRHFTQIKKNPPEGESLGFA